MHPSVLSQETFTAIIGEAEIFHDILSEQFGLLCKYCYAETDFILKSAELANGLLTYDEDEMDELFFGEPPSRIQFHIALKKILQNIEEL